VDPTNHGSKILGKNCDHGWAWWHMTVVPATKVAEIGGLQFEASLGKVSMVFHLKSKLKKQKDWRQESISRALAYQGWSPEFNSQCCKKGKKCVLLNMYRHFSSHYSLNNIV
jgi:hypothetical protein